MGHWRDGGIGNMAGSDDRPIEEWTLLEKLADVATAPVGAVDRPYVMRAPGDWATPLKALAQAAFDEIQRLRGVDTKLRLTERHYRDALDQMGAEWLPIDTAPVEPGHTVSSHYRFRCMLQDAQGDVFEGAAYYVKIGRATTHQTLRWQNARHRQCFPKFWKPLPAPKVTL